MQEKETELKESEKSVMRTQTYEYRLSLSYRNPIEAEAIRMIQNRNRLDYPTIKLFLLKGILHYEENKGTGMHTEQSASGILEIKQYLSGLEQEIKKLQKEMADIKERHNPKLQEEPSASATGGLDNTSDDQMDLLGFDESFTDNLLSEME